eukprot:TRINITY_DN14884_c0_g1_i1.p1 TRINITY_DN14884_c0_g1~~TRINITY_DN14884_c0_g1_i1.p1  ORF type:complete len:149 (-),score=11.20 TRINITY_DN14884_c0_g1_i1:168-614(-)
MDMKLSCLLLALTAILGLQVEAMTTEYHSQNSDQDSDSILEFSEVPATSYQEPVIEVPNTASQYNSAPFTKIEERSFGGLGLGWIAAIALMAFAFVNTILIGATVVISTQLFQWLLGILGVIAPQVAFAFTNLVAAAGFATVPAAVAG